MTPGKRDAQNEVGLHGVAAVLPPQTLDLGELARRGLLHSPPESLAAFGFRRAHLADAEHDAGALALRAARAALDDAGLAPQAIDVLIWASALPHNHLRDGPPPSAAPPDRDGLLKGFRYAGGWLQEELGLHEAQTLAVAQQGCVSMFSALRLARSLLLAEPNLHNVLCVGVDVLRPGAPREILYNVISDAACAVVVGRGGPRDRWAGYRQLSRGYYWDPLTRQAEILAAYFPTSRLVLGQLLQEQGLTAADVDRVIPTGVNRPSWEILLRLIGVPADRLYLGAEPFGHTIMADSFIHLQELRKSGAAPAGSRLLLFSYGFGSSWCGLLLEH
jgi:3-oxoacyl-[acyl-carrier-protein] synthase-3